MKCLTASQSVVDSASANDYVGSEQQAIHSPWKQTRLGTYHFFTSNWVLTGIRPHVGNSSKCKLLQLFQQILHHRRAIQLTSSPTLRQSNVTAYAFTTDDIFYLLAYLLALSLPVEQGSQVTHFHAVWHVMPTSFWVAFEVCCQPFFFKIFFQLFTSAVPFW